MSRKPHCLIHKSLYYNIESLKETKHYCILIYCPTDYSMSRAGLSKAQIELHHVAGIGTSPQWFTHKSVRQELDKQQPTVALIKWPGQPHVPTEVENDSLGIPISGPCEWLELVYFTATSHSHMVRLPQTVWESSHIPLKAGALSPQCDRGVRYRWKQWWYD